MPAITSATIATPLSVGTTNHHRPPIAAAINQGPTSSDMIASVVPPAFARQAASGCPCIKCDQLVVMPQDGHGRPTSHSNVQRYKPNCRCVPNPRGSGSSRLAIANSTSNVVPTIAAVQRALGFNPGGAAGSAVLTVGKGVGG